jgi:hypothetical protein
MLVDRVHTRAERGLQSEGTLSWASQTQIVSSLRLHFGLRGVSQASGKFISYGSCSFS